MKKEAKILRYNKKDSDGDIFIKGSVRFKNPVPLLKDFNNSNVLGKVNVFDTPTGLKANFEDEHSGLYPAVGIKVIKRDGNTILECELFSVGLCSMPNLDPEIKPI